MKASSQLVYAAPFVCAALFATMGCDGGGSGSAGGDLSALTLDPDQEIHRIAFGSCADETAPQPIWDAILEADPDLFIFSGDAVHNSGGPAALDEAYAKLAAIEGFRKLRETKPMLAIWDDHDFGLNDGGASFEGKDVAKQKFLDFWQIPADSPRATRPGLYDAVTVGPEGRRLQIILIDTRWFRDPLRRSEVSTGGHGPYIEHEDPSAEMIGEEQWEWIIEKMEQPADVRILVSSIPLLTSREHWEKWTNFPEDVSRIVGVIETTNAYHTLIVSGGRHFGAIYRGGLGVPYPLHEVATGSLNMADAPPAEAVRDMTRIGDPFYVPNFGVIEIDWEKDSVRLELRDEKGVTLRHMILDLATLEM
ncbi:MAG: alkaline phosphatase family protein [bacterium]|nr:alkaline phosphatase family protein [bacterium]